VAVAATHQAAVVVQYQFLGGFGTLGVVVVVLIVWADWPCVERVPTLNNDCNGDGLPPWPPRLNTMTNSDLRRRNDSWSPYRDDDDNDASDNTNEEYEGRFV
jgi:hypothetical protein